MKKPTLSYLFVLFFLANACQRTPPADPSPPPPSGSQVIHVTGLTSTSQASVLLLPDSSLQLSATITPANASDPKLIYVSSNTSIVRTDTTGRITGVGLGLATVTIKSEDNPSLTVTIQVAVVRKYATLVAGYGPDAYAHQALQWTDGVYTVLSPGWGGYNAAGIAPAGSDWYVAGMMVNHDGWSIATFWKNGVATQLSDPADEYNHNLTAQVISGQQIYLAGYNVRYINYPSWDPLYQNEPVWNALYYTINGNTVTRTLLEPDTNNVLSVAYSMAVSGADVYVAGGSQTGKQNRIAAYWKNGQSGKVLLANASDWSEAMGLALQGGDVYVAGYEECSVSSGCPPMAKLWKNNAITVTNLTNGTVAGVASCLAVNDTAEFVGGNQTNLAGVKQAMLWRVRGNTVSSIPVSDGLTEAGVNGIALSGNDVFLAGYQVDSVTKIRIAAYWRVYGNIVSPPVRLPTLYYFSAAFPSEANAIRIQ